MSSFRDSMGKGPKKEEPSVPQPHQQYSQLEDGEIVEVEDVTIEEIEAPSFAAAPATPSYSGPAVKKKSSSPEDAVAKRRRNMIIAVFLVPVILIGMMALLGGGKSDSATDIPKSNIKPDVASTSPKAPAAVNPVTPATPGDAVEQTTPDAATPDKGDGTDPLTNPGSNSELGLPSAAEKAAADKLLDRAEAFIKKADHPADGQSGVLVNDEDKFAAIMSKALGVPVTASDPKIRKKGTVYLSLERRIGLCIIITPAGTKRIPQIREVPIITTGIK